mmetsp:Transcript_22578/g.53297  ORF Transcript_22578/g.53297 Transcript_22578/m.53297 type:complete len:220 (+) Transcript_22578:1123-1782(+)
MHETILKHLVQKGRFVFFFVVVVPVRCLHFVLVFAVKFVIVEESEALGVFSVVRSHQLIEPVNSPGTGTTTGNPSAAPIITLAHAAKNFLVASFFFLLLQPLAGCHSGIFVSFAVRDVVHDVLQVVLVEIVWGFFLVLFLVLLGDGESKIFEPRDFLFLLFLGFLFHESALAILLLFPEFFSLTLQHGLPTSVSRTVGILVLVVCGDIKLHFPFVVVFL